MNDDNQLTPNNNMIANVDPSAVAAGELAKIRYQTNIQMAMMNPRNEANARSLILQACKNPTFAALVEYSKPVAGKQIKGPSIRLAEVILRYWRNVSTETMVIFEDEKLRRIKVILTDLETNTSYSKEIQITKTVERKSDNARIVLDERLNTYGETVYVVVATDDELQTKESALISKVVRNEGLRLIPGDIIEEALNVAKVTLRNRDSKDPEKAKKDVLDAFMLLGIKPIDIEKYLKHSINTVSPAELETLRGVYSAVKEGTSWASFVEPEKTEDTKAQKKKEDEKIKSGPKVTAGQVKKIIDTLEAEGIDGEMINKEFKVTKLEEIPKASIAEVLKYIKNLNTK